MKPYYSYEDIIALDFPPVIVYAVPVMVFLTVMEWMLRRTDYVHEVKEKAEAAGFDDSPLIAEREAAKVAYQQRSFASRLSGLPNPRTADVADAPGARRCRRAVPRDW